jgi:hypothetical protein
VTKWSARVGSLAISASLALASLVDAPGVHASVNSDIPGVPLPSNGIVEAQVGGPVVDLVYAIQVPNASVLIATVRGEPGSELGLYAFGSGSDSVLTSLPLTSSAKPGGVQTISIRVIRENTIYLNVNGRNTDRPYLFTLRASILHDSTPPTIKSVEVQPRAQSSAVCFKIRAADPISGITNVTINDLRAAISGDWLPFTGNDTQCVAAVPGDGLRTFAVKVRNGVDLESRPFTVSTVIDDAAPALLNSVPSSGLLLSPRTAVRWRFDEKIRTVESLAQSVRVYRQDGQTVDGSVRRSRDGTMISWVPTKNISLGTVLVASLGAVRDYVGNILEFTETRVLTRKRTSTIAIRQVGAPKGVVISITAPSWLVGESVSIEQRSSRGWTSIGRVNLRAATFRFRMEVLSGARVRVTYSGSDRFTGSSSGALVIR